MNCSGLSAFGVQVRLNLRVRLERLWLRGRSTVLELPCIFDLIQALGWFIVLVRVVEAGECLMRPEYKVRTYGLLDLTGFCMS